MTATHPLHSPAPVLLTSSLCHLGRTFSKTQALNRLPELLLEIRLACSRFRDKETDTHPLPPARSLLFLGSCPSTTLCLPACAAPQGTLNTLLFLSHVHPKGRDYTPRTLCSPSA